MPGLWNPETHLSKGTLMTATETTTDLSLLEDLEFTPQCEARAGYYDPRLGKVLHIEPPCKSPAEWAVVLHESAGCYTDTMSLCDRHLRWLQNADTPCRCGTTRYIIATQRIGA